MKNGKKEIKSLKKGDHFWNYSFFTGNQRKELAYCKEFTEVLYVKREEFI